jgi:ABC-type nickel/cobalt efflux system permease component RcnA
VRLAILLLAVLAVGSPASAHVVASGVGTQTELRISPREIEVKFNLGFSSLLGLGQLKTMDRDGDSAIDRAEQTLYLKDLIKRVLPQLALHVDGERVALRVVEQRGLGILGPIEQVGFDTWFELRADVDLGPGEHTLRFLDGSYTSEVSEQLLWLVRDKARFERFDVTQERPAGPRKPPRGGVAGFRGRDLTLTLAFNAEALADDSALALLEPSLEGVAAAGGALREAIGGEVAEDLNGWSFRGVRFAEHRGRAAFRQGAPMAKERVLDVAGGEAKPSPDLDDPIPAAEVAPPPDESSAMIAALRQPGWSLAILLGFMLWGMVHALAPGHGKTMVAAYLLGTEGRMSDAFKLGIIVTITHTIALYTVGLLIVWLVTESDWTRFLRQTAKHLTLLSGVALVAYGLYLGRQRWNVLAAISALEAMKAAADEGPHDHSHDHAAPAHDHGHDHAAPAHDHGHDHAAPAHDHGHDHAAPAHDHGHDHAAPAHDHGHDHAAPAHDLAPPATRGHSHDHGAMSEEEHALAHARDAASVTSFRDLLVLGVTGGLVPCPAGVTLVIFSLSFEGQNTLKCFVYLSAFSIGLAGVLVAVAAMMVATRHFLVPERSERSKKVLDVLPLISCMAIVAVGIFLCVRAFVPGIFDSVQGQVMELVQ